MKTQYDQLHITGMMKVRQAMGGRWIIGHSSNDSIIFYAQNEDHARKVLQLAEAAPELLEALQMALVELRAAYSLTEWSHVKIEQQANKNIEQIESAIKKATE